MDKQLTVLITRPQPGADRFAEMLEGLAVIVSPVMEITPVAADMGALDTAVITSSYAIPALPPATRCYCVGEATTRRADGAGLRAIMAGETAQALARRVIQDRPDGQIVYARGRYVAFDMLGALQDAGLNAVEMVVYDQKPRPLSPQARDLLTSGAPVLLPLFSARSSALFFDACPTASNLRVIAMSDTVANTVPQTHRHHMSVLPNPDATTMALAVRNAR